MIWEYDEDEDEPKKKRMDSKSKHPFAITCRKCGCNDIVVIAYEYHDLGIRCRGCGFELSCDRYYTQEYDYSNSR